MNNTKSIYIRTSEFQMKTPHICIIRRIPSVKFWGGEHEFARLTPKAREPLGGSGGMLPRTILKNRVSLRGDFFKN